MYIKISRSSGTCLIVFENNDQFTGKELLRRESEFKADFSLTKI